MSKGGDELDKVLGYGVGITFATALAVAAAIAGALLIGFLAIPLIILALAYIGWRFYDYHQNRPEVLERKARERTAQLYRDALARAKPIDKMEFGKGLGNHIPVSVPDDVFSSALEAGLHMYDVEAWGGLIPEPPAICNSIEGARYRDFISKASAISEHDIKAIQRTIGNSVREALQYVIGTEDGESGITQPLYTFIPPKELNEVVERIVLPYFASDVRHHFPELREVLDRNFQAAKGVMPSEYPKDDAPFAYLRDTPLYKLLSTPITIHVPRSARWEHTIVIGGTGHGKTTLLENLILRDIQDPAQPSIVVVDSQRALIAKLSRLAAVHERPLIIIDPKDAPALNVFALNAARFSSYDPIERERIRNHTIETFNYLFDSLLGADLTVRQGALFNYLIMAMLAMPSMMGRNATLMDIVNITEKPSAYAEAIGSLDRIAQDFFRNDFTKPQYAPTKEQIRYRLHAILSNPTLARLFLAPTNKIDFFSELNSGAILLIDTDKGFLGSKNSGYLGRIAITLVLQAILERDASAAPQREVFLYVDEAGEYFDRSIDKFLTEARKQRAGITLAHQHAGQMQPELRASVAANTTTKYAGGIAMLDARALANDMRTTPEFLLAQEKLHFACYIRNVTKTATTVPVQIGILDGEPALSEETYAAFRTRNRDRLTSTEPTPEVPPLSDDEKSNKPTEW